MDETTHKIDAAAEEALWDDLAERIDAFAAAWEAGEPIVGEFLPAGPSAARGLVLVELVKVDLEQRQRRGRPLRRLEDYIAEHPELDAGAGPPADLIYEEHHVRLAAGEEIELTELLERFPGRAVEVGRLLGVSHFEATTTIGRSEALDSVEVDSRIDDFDLLVLLGRGSFAKVFLAKQRSMQRMVAVKVSADRGAEPQTMARLDHPHIVRVYDQRSLPEQGLRLLYMQYIPGGTLREVVRHVSSKPPAERSGKDVLAVVDAALSTRGEPKPHDAPLRRALSDASWCEAVCLLGARLAAALDYAHERDVLHRDVKPANILVAADASPLLVDFNVSAAGADCEGESYFGGSLAYMPPEQIDACNQDRPDALPGSVGATADVYSLAVVLWELFFGQRPFDDCDLKGRWEEILARLAATRRVGLPEPPAGMELDQHEQRLVEVLQAALQPQADKRTPDAGALARRLERVLHPRADRLLRSRRPGCATWMQRWPLAAMVLAMLVPNACFSSINIPYNRDQIVQHLSEPLQATFESMLGWANAVLYPAGLGVALLAAWPVLLRVRRAARRGERPSDAPWYARRCLWLGDVASFVAIGAWTVSGFAFPLWLRLRGGDQFSVQDWIHFVSSHLLCGLIAATLVFLAVSCLAVRRFLPLLLDDEPPREGYVYLRRLARRSWWYSAGAFAAPFLAVIVLVFAAGARVAEAANYFAVLGVVGLACSILFLWGVRTLQDDAEALDAYARSVAEIARRE